MPVAVQCVPVRLTRGSVFTPCRNCLLVFVHHVCVRQFEMLKARQSRTRFDATHGELRVTLLRSLLRRSCVSQPRVARASGLPWESKTVITYPERVAAFEQRR